MGYIFNNDTPIYMQIIEYIKAQIISNAYKPNDKIPSVRELSFDLGANPNTVQRALAELEDMGLIYTERTNGKYVTGNTELIKNIKQQTIKEKIDEFCVALQKMGLDKQEIIEFLLKEIKEK